VEPFFRIGDLIKERWRSTCFDEEGFADIATDVLGRELPALGVTLDDVLDWVHASRRLPTQIEFQFGQPITVFHDPRFYIDVLTWVDSTTNIHEHGFSGAFGVLHGSSLHARHAFDVERRYCEHLFQGRTTLTELEVLRAGDVRPIYAGARSAHALFHLDRPSLSVVVRNPKTTIAPIQLCYLRSGLAYNPFHTDVESQRLVRTLEIMNDIEHPGLLARARAMIDERDPFTAFKIAAFLARKLPHHEFVAFLGGAPFRHAELFRAIAENAADMRRETNLINRRRAIKNEDHRYLVALLLNLRDPADILALVKARVPGADPVDTVMRWVGELAAAPAIEPGEPNAIGIALDELALGAMRSMLGGASDDQVIAALADEYDGIDELRGELRELCAAFRASVFFAPLFHQA
jgi:hypothetical protein